MTKQIPLTRGKFALVDDTDYQELSRFRWHARFTKGKWYAGRAEPFAGGYRLVLMHRFIMQSGKDEEVDHVDHDGLNNQRLNLRNADHARNLQNQQQQRRTAGHQAKGVSPRFGKWRAQIQVDGKKIHIGTFATHDEATAAYDAAARRYFGEFAALNESEA